MLFPACLDQTGTTEAETGMEVDNDVTISYEEQRRAYVREVREQVANAPLIDEVSEDAEGGSASDGRRRGDSHSNTLVFVRQTSSRCAYKINESIFHECYN